MSDTPLSEILNSEPEPQASEEAPKERPRDELGRFIAQPGEVGYVEPEAEPQPSGTPPQQQEQAQEEEPKTVPIQALMGEREKRQQAEAQFNQLLQYLNAQQPQQQPQQKPDMFADPDGYEAYLRREILAQVTQELQPAIQHQGSMNRAEVSEMLARQRWEDYDKKLEVFAAAVKENPFLAIECQRSPDPSTYAYNAASKIAEARSMGEAPNQADLEAAMRAKIMAELGLDKPQVPSTLAGMRSVGSRQGPAWSGPTALSDILKT